PEEIDTNLLPDSLKTLNKRLRLVQLKYKRPLIGRNGWKITTTGGGEIQYLVRDDDSDS
ncbi:unnamed protein product, partial [marine sediment metagenome]